MYCPECNSDVIVERDCDECGGFGHDNLDISKICEACDGVGSVPGTWECLECGYEWDE